MTVNDGHTRDAHTLRLLAGLIVVGGASMAIVGIPDLPLMWPMYKLGVVLPSCGLTRGVVEIFRGDFARAWRFNPASFVVVGAAAVLLARAASNRPFTLPMIHSARMQRVVTIAGGAALLALWVNQQLNADFVIHGRV